MILRLLLIVKKKISLYMSAYLSLLRPRTPEFDLPGCSLRRSRLHWRHCIHARQTQLHGRMQTFHLPICFRSIPKKYLNH